jgi:arylsulfatase A-like enzyme
VGLATWVQRADSKIGIHPDELTLAELLRDAGYATACIGKWHLGAQAPFLPSAQGFDHYFGLLHNLDPVETVYFEEEGGVPLLRNGKVVKRPAEPAELTAAYTDEAISFMRANKKKPFFLYMPHTMAHIPMGVTPDFAGTSNFGLYGDVLQCLDYHVGRLMEELTNLGIEDNTVVVYASDNGRGPGRIPSQPIQGHKLSTWEGGIRVPCIAWGPGVGVKAGQVSDTVTRAMDWYPTFATLAGVKVPGGRILDGRDLHPLLTGQTPHVPMPDERLSLNADLPLRRPWRPAGEWEDILTRDEYSEAFFYHGSLGELAAVRWREWKLRLNPTTELYNLAQDPGETKVVRKNDIVRKLRGMAITFQDEMRISARPAGTYGGPQKEEN